MARQPNPIDDLMNRARLVELVGEAGWRAVREMFPGPSFDQWSEGLDTLVSSGLGGRAVALFARVTPACARLVGAEAALRLVPVVQQAARRAGEGPAVELLVASGHAARLLAGRDEFASWLAAMEELAAAAPESIQAVARQTEFILSNLDAAGFRRWLLAGLRAAGDDPGRRLAYLSLADGEALRLFRDGAGDTTFHHVERHLRIYLAALWGIRPVIRAAPRGPAVKPVRRTTFDRYMIRMPESFPGYSAAQSERLYRASVAHVGAHMMFTPERFPVRELKPIQVALVSLVEDARVETLAMREFPGLGRLWSSFHVAEASGSQVAPVLLARLSRALIDPAFRDHDPWVRKGREMFHDQRGRWDDSEMSREMGSLLGNDLGQMRVQFNAKTYVVQPPYRDDNLGLWDFGEPSTSADEQAEIMTDSIKIQQTENEDQPHQRERAEQAREEASVAARLSAVEDDVGLPVARYPEWDYAIGHDRVEWTTIMDFSPRTARPEIIDRIMAEYPEVTARISRLIRSARVSRPVRVRRQPDGDRLDLDAAIQATIDRRSGLTPDPRVYETSVLRNRDLSILVLLDISESTKDIVRGTTTSVFALERAATALLSTAMAEVGDPYAVRAFCSDTRHEVRYYRIKEFGEPYGDAVKSRLAGLRGGYSTRIGAAIRHAGAELRGCLTHRRLLLIVTDGEPSDVDVLDRTYLVEDARRAVQLLAHEGIDVFCVGLDGNGTGYLSRIFGRRNVMLIDRVAALPEKLPMLYFRLTH